MRLPTIPRGSEAAALRQRGTLERNIPEGHIRLEASNWIEGEDRTPHLLTRLILHGRHGYSCSELDDRILAALVDLIPVFLGAEQPEPAVNVTLQQPARGKKRRRILSDPEVAPSADADEGKAAIKRRMLEGR